MLRGGVGLGAQPDVRRMAVACSGDRSTPVFWAQMNRARCGNMLEQAQAGLTLTRRAPNVGMLSVWCTRYCSVKKRTRLPRNI